MNFKRTWRTTNRKLILIFFLTKTLNIWFIVSTIGESLIKIRHTLVTDNYLAAEEIQNQDWEYFIECVIEVCKFNNPSIRPDEEFLLSTIENDTIAKWVYTMIYNVIAINFSLTISKLSVDERKDINDDF